MNEAQKNSIETLAGRSMTAEEVAMADERNDKALADSLSVGRTKFSASFHTQLQVLDTLGPVEGGTFLDALDSLVSAGKDALPVLLQPYFSAIKRSVAALYVDPGLAFGSANTQAVLDLLASLGVVSPQAAATLKAIAVQADPISVDTVSNILNMEAE